MAGVRLLFPTALRFASSFCPFFSRALPDFHRALLPRRIRLADKILPSAAASLVHTQRSLPQMCQLFALKERHEVTELRHAVVREDDLLKIGQVLP